MHAQSGTETEPKARDSFASGVRRIRAGIVNADGAVELRHNSSFKHFSRSPHVIVFCDSNFPACEDEMDEGLIIAAIDEEIGRLLQARALLSGSDAATAALEKATPTQKAVGRRKVSPAARRRMAEAQKKRWAAIKVEAGKTTPTEKSGKAASAQKSPKRRRLSPAARKRIAEAQRKRWAAAKAAKSARAKKFRKKAPAKKAAAVKIPAKAAKKAARKAAVKRAPGKYPPAKPEALWCEPLKAA